MQSNDQFSSSGRFTLGKDPRYPVDKELGGQDMVLKWKNFCGMWRSLFYSEMEFLMLSTEEIKSSVTVRLSSLP